MATAIWGSGDKQQDFCCLCRAPHRQASGIKPCSIQPQPNPCQGPLPAPCCRPLSTAFYWVMSRNQEKTTKIWVLTSESVELGPNKDPHLCLTQTPHRALLILERFPVLAFQPRHLIFVLDTNFIWPLPLFSWLHTIAAKEMLWNYSGTRNITSKWLVLKN